MSIQRNKIFGRLGSTKYKPPKNFQYQKQVHIVPRLQSMVEKARGHPQNERKASLIVDLENLQHAIEDVERDSSDNRIESLRLVVATTYRVTIDGTSMRGRLGSVGFTGEYNERREVRQIQALGILLENISLFIDHCQTSSHDLFILQA